MRTPAANRSFRQATGHNGAMGAFTLNEMMVTVAIFSLIMLGVSLAHLNGLRMFTLTKAKLSATDEARYAISRLTEEIRTAYDVRIGQGDESSFTSAAPNSAQVGTAIQIQPEFNNTNDWIRYYWDGNERRLKRVDSSSSSVDIIANSVSNSVVFSAENFQGQVLSNNFNNRVIGLTMQFYQLQYPVVEIGPGQLYDYYQLRTKITRRALR